MSGVAVIWYLLKTNGPVLAVVPASRISAGDMQLNTAMPAISVTQISSVPYNMIRINESPKLHTDRVQVSVLVKGPQGTPSGTGYPGVKSLLKLVLAACPSQRGVVNGITVDSIIPQDEGPDWSDSGTSLYSGSRDFLVKYLQ